MLERLVRWTRLEGWFRPAALNGVIFGVFWSIPFKEVVNSSFSRVAFPEVATIAPAFNFTQQRFVC